MSTKEELVDEFLYQDLVDVLKQCGEHSLAEHLVSLSPHGTGTQRFKASLGLVRLRSETKEGLLDQVVLLMAVRNQKRMAEVRDSDAKWAYAQLARLVGLLMVFLVCQDQDYEWSQLAALVGMLGMLTYLGAVGLVDWYRMQTDYDYLLRRYIKMKTNG